MVFIENGTFTDAHLHISALESRTFENQPIFHFGVHINDSHYIFAARAISALGNHPLVNHPSEAALEILRHTVNFYIFLKGKLHKVSLDLLVAVLSQFEFAQGKLLVTGLLELLYLLLLSFLILWVDHLTGEGGGHMKEGAHIGSLGGAFKDLTVISLKALLAH